MEPQPEVLNDTEVMKKMEDDHLRLQRQVRMIQTDRLQRAMGVHPQFRRQDNLLRTLKAEYVDLAKDLKIARAGAHKKKDKRMKKDLKSSLVLMEATEVNCDGGNAITHEMDGLLLRSNKEITKLRELSNACQGEIESRRFQSESRLLSTENKLETAMLRFNMVQFENQKIRREIEHMLKDRAIFNQAWDKMLTALGKGKKFLSDLFESSTLAYDQRDEWVSKLRSVQEKGKMDQLLQVQEMRDLKKAYDHEMKIYLFLAKKGVMRVNPHVKEREEEKKRKEEEELKKEFDKHITILNEITEYTQEQNYNKIIEDFLKREQENFSIYKLITDFCAENEVLSRDLERIRRDIEDRRDFNEVKEIDCNNKLQNLKQQLDKQTATNQDLKTKCDQQEMSLSNAMKKVNEIFKLLDCSLEPFQDLLGDKQPTLQTLKLSLCLITEKINQYVETVYYCERTIKRTDKASTTSRLKKFTVRCQPRHLFQPNPIDTADPCPSCIETRWMARVTESKELPFSKQEALSALRMLARDPAYIRSDRVHPLAYCRASASRKLLATRHMNF